MSKNLFARDQVMEDYINALLTDDEPDKARVKPKPSASTARSVTKRTSYTEVEQPLQSKLKPQTESQQATLKTAYKEAAPEPEQVKENVSKLLAKVAAPQVAPTPKVQPKPSVTPAPKTAPAAQPIEEKAPAPIIDTGAVDSTVPPAGTDDTDKAYRQGDFQALFFTVAGLTLAVPLTELGGIHNMTKLSSLFGKPNWFLGVMMHREQKLNVVDSARWVMPEKYDEELEASLDYQYVIMMGESPWGMACETLVNTVTLTQDDVKWRESKGKRPWLAGLVKEKMCALLDVEELIKLLDKGLGS